MNRGKIQQKIQLLLKTIGDLHFGNLIYVVHEVWSRNRLAVYSTLVWTQP